MCRTLNVSGSGFHAQRTRPPCNGELVGYAIHERMAKNLVIQALFRATASKHPDKGLIAHSDRGVQYCAHDYQKLLQQFGMIASMSRKGDGYDLRSDTMQI